jgi:TolA-binding protein
MAILVAAMLVLGGCGDSAQTLFDTAQLEEKQNNPQHAAQLYEEIVKTYPDSKVAAAARQRLEALQKNR